MRALCFGFRNILITKVVELGQQSSKPERRSWSSHVANEQLYLRLVPEMIEGTASIDEYTSV
jgi:hypothetical protein